jgi:hypothetical protein
MAQVSEEGLRKNQNPKSLKYWDRPLCLSMTREHFSARGTESCLGDQQYH